MLVNTNEMFRKAQKNGYAIPHFNVNNAEMVKAIVEICEEMNTPVMLSLTTGVCNFLSPELAIGMCVSAAKSASIPIAVHLDHHYDPEDIKHKIDLGATSVMIDGSKETYEKNIELTKSVVEYAHKRNVSVEAELGAVPGSEDEHYVKDEQLTPPDKVKDFVKKTNINSLAVAIGTAHGLFEGDPEIRFDLLNQITKLTKIPLVLHGGSGIPKKDIKKSVKYGICKINVATELKVAFAKGLKNFFQKSSSSNPREYYMPSIDAVKFIAKTKIMMFGSAGKGSQ